MNIEEIWQSEESLETVYQELLSLSKFDRTKDASKLVHKLMAKLAGSSVAWDQKQWIKDNVQDFNIASQLLLNIQPGNVTFRLAELSKRMQELEKKYEVSSVRNPFGKGAKLAEDDGKEETHVYNKDLSTIRNHKILANWVGMNSFRVSPIGSTPALADLLNLSSLSILGLKEFCDGTICLVDHEKLTAHLEVRQNEDGAFMANGLVHPIVSKSGGDIVTRALPVRWLTHQILTRTNCYVIPKYDSLLVAGELGVPEDLKEWLVEFKG
jgi:hypothetical protein